MTTEDTAPRLTLCVALTVATPALLFGALVLLTHPAADYSLWLDESWSVRAISSHDVKTIVETVGRDYHSPAYFWGLSAWSHVAGVSERMPRYPSVLCALFTAAIIYRLTVDLYRSKAAGVLAAVALAVMPFHIRFAHKARMYAALAAGVAGSMWLFWRYLARPRRTVALVYVLVTAMTVYVQYLGAFVIPLQAAYAALILARKKISPQRRGEHGEKRNPSASWGVRLSPLLPIAAGCLFLPWLPTFLDQFNNPDYDHIHNHALPSNWHTIRTTLVEAFFAGQTALYLLLVVVAIFTLRRSPDGGCSFHLYKPKALGLLAMWGIGWLALVWISNVKVPHFQPRSALPALLVLAILAGVTLSRLLRLVNAALLMTVHRLPHVSGVGLVRLSRAVTAATLLLLIAGNLTNYDTYQAHDPHYRDAVEELARGYQSGDLVFWQTNSTFHDIPIPHYLEYLLPGAETTWLNELIGNSRVFADAVGEHTRFWFLQTLPVDNRWVGETVPHVEVGNVHVDAFQIALYEIP